MNIAAGYDPGRMSKGVGVGVAPALGEAIDWYQLSCATRTGNFDPRKFLATVGEGRRVVAFPKRQTIFAQRDAAKGGFLDYGGNGLEVHRSLLNVVLHD
jgi:hypothetical protein